MTETKTIEEPSAAQTMAGAKVTETTVAASAWQRRVMERMRSSDPQPLVLESQHLSNETPPGELAG